MYESTMEFLKFFNKSIRNIHVLTEEMFAQMQEARNKLIDNYGIDCYELIEALTTTIAKVSGKLDFLDDVFTRFANECIEENPFINKLCEHDKNVVLDKIRAMIESHRRKTASIDPYDLVGDCLEIIDKYKAESEET